jgi:hypothetical protein
VAAVADSLAAALAAVAAARSRGSARDEVFGVLRLRTSRRVCPKSDTTHTGRLGASPVAWEAALGSRHDNEGSALILLVARAL